MKYFSLIDTSVCVVTALLIALPAQAWWDTFSTKFRPVPLVKEIEAEACTGINTSTLIHDAEADGGQGGKAAILSPDGAGLTTDLDLKPGLYALFTIARDPKGATGIALMTLDVIEHATARTNSWTLPVAYRESYFASGQFYFPAYAGGRYTVTSRLSSKLAKTPADPSFTRMVDPATLTLTNRVMIPLLVDRLELRDVLANCARVGAKTGRMLTDNAELAKVRADFAASKTTFLQFGKEKVFLTEKTAPAWLTAGRSGSERQSRNHQLWSKVPDFNDPYFNVSTTPWAAVIGRDSPGLIRDNADAYELTGNPEFGWDGAVLLCALAEKYPALDYYAQAIGSSASQTPNVGNPTPFLLTIPAGKNVYRGWSGYVMVNLATAYDKLFDFIKGNQALADYVGSRIPGIRTPADVIALLDVNLLQHGMDACNRGYIEGTDLPKALIPLVQGVNPISEAMLDNGIFKTMCMNLSFRGGIEDQAVSAYSRDGVHYIGSAGYVGRDLQSIADVLSRYCRQGGAARFNIADESICPQMKEADSTVLQLHLGGGYRMIQGDAGDLRLLRDPSVQAFPSRQLGGFGAAILEDGQFQPDPLAKRGAALIYGIGRGHAHQDTLNLELMAHGCRVAPDLGGREEGPRKGRPCMRNSSVHNLVEVDNRNFQNTYAGSTIAGTGWNTSFEAQPGAQFMEHHARATSHPEVSLYMRQTAFIDAGDRDSYVFDVFRVRGGKTHTYAFHGGATDALAVNAALKPATSDAATHYLRDHFAGSQREGSTPAVLEADWPLTPEMQKLYQGAAYESNRVVTTRLSLFTHDGDPLWIGNAYSKAYRYNYPFLYVRGQPEDSGSAFPALMEPFAGTPFIAAKKMLPVTPRVTGAEQPVALEVTTTAGRTDLLYASTTPDLQSEISDFKSQVAGKFAIVSRDASGFRLAHLVGGTTLECGDISITTPRHEYRTRLTATRYNHRQFDTETVLPPRLLKGAWVGIGANAPGALRHAFKLESLTPAGKGTRVTHEKTALYYRSTIVNLDTAAGTIESEIEPGVFGCDVHFIDSTTLANEDASKTWRTTLTEAGRWMHLGWPGYRGSYPDRIAMDTIPDANGDGHHTLKLIACPKDVKQQGSNKVGDSLLELDVTRITPDGHTFYFAMPSDEAYQRGGWQYAERKLVNETGTRTWRAGYPGSTFLWKPDGPITTSDFRDTDGDGKIKINAYLFGSGDEMQSDTFVYARRLDQPGLYEVRANVACTLGLPAAGRHQASLSTNGSLFTPIPTRTVGQQLVVTLTEEMLADGIIQVKLYE